MSNFIVVALVAYASVVRPVFNEHVVDPHVMWVWQVFTILLAIVPSWVPGCNEVALTACFAIACVDTSVLSRNVRDVVFPAIRRRLDGEKITTQGQRTEQVETAMGTDE